MKTPTVWALVASLCALPVVPAAWLWSSEPSSTMVLMGPLTLAWVAVVASGAHLAASNRHRTPKSNPHAAMLLIGVILFGTLFQRVPLIYMSGTTDHSMLARLLSQLGLELLALLAFGVVGGAWVTNLGANTPQPPRPGMARQAVLTGVFGVICLGTAMLLAAS